MEVCTVEILLPARAPRIASALAAAGFYDNQGLQPVFTVFWHDRQTPHRERGTDPGCQTLDCGT